MVCSTAILTSSLALSLLRQSAPPTESFVLSPFSFNSALAIVHDGAGGITQTELTNLLLNGCSSSDVTDFYSSLALSLPSTNESGVAFKSANRFYVDESISLNSDYQKHVEDKYQAKVENIGLRHKEDAANEINKFVEGATNGKIKEVITADGISDDANTVLINALHFAGKWKIPFNPSSSWEGIFNEIITTRPRIDGLVEGEKEVEYMSHYAKTFRQNENNDVGSLLLIPYQDTRFNFFYLMPNKSSNLGKMRDELTGDKLINVIKGATDLYMDIRVPKIKVESKLDGVEILSKLGVKSLFTDGADLSKISSNPLKVSKIAHNAVIEVNEDGTEAAAATNVEMINKMMRPKITIDRPFLYGILRDEDILFIGQFA